MVIIFQVVGFQFETLIITGRESMKQITARHFGLSTEQIQSVSSSLIWQNAHYFFLNQTCQLCTKI